MAAAVPAAEAVPLRSTAKMQSISWPSAQARLHFRATVRNKSINKSSGLNY
jgi:hypothetical protein